MINRIEPN